MSKKTIVLFLSFLLVLPFVSSASAIYVGKYDSCDSLGPWTINPYMSPSIYTDCIEGVGSLHFGNNTNNNQLNAQTSNMMSLTTKNASLVLGFWVKVLSSSSTHTGLSIYLYNTVTGYYAAIAITYEGGTTTNYTLFGHGYSSNFQLPSYFHFDLDTWTWMEIVYTIATDDANLYCDGVSKGNCGPGVGMSLNSTNTNLLVISQSGWAPGQVQFDYFRIADLEEYPPSYSAYPLTITALNVANNSAISVPMKINDIEYYTPISASLTSGIYIVQPEDYGFNTTHYWRFVNWTDGADRTRTINFTGPASYTAYYQLTKIQSWGGYFNFFLGLAGLGMMASSWFVLKWQWDEKNYGVAILTWMLLLIVGFALCTILFGG